ncbi:MAG: D-alanyl-D-alanine carboxypeptidase family protein [Thermoleophilaceae bacterium]
MRLRAAAAAAVLLLCLLWAMPASARAPRPSLSSASAGIVVDARSGDAMLAKRADARRPIASTTKLMTALLVLESDKLGRTFTAPAYHALPAESKINLRQGERMKGRDLLTALLLESANDAAVDLAQGVAGSRPAFVAQMNRRARQLGLRNTHYANPIGLDDAANYSSARDLAKLARRLMADPTFAAIVDLPRATLRSGDHPRTIRNRNLLVGRYPFVDGVKTGHTIRAHYILVGAAHGNGGKVLSVVLGEPSESARDADTLSLLRWAIDQYRRVTILRPGRTVAYAKVAHHPDLRIRLTTRHGATYTLRRGEKLSTRIHVPDELEGPIAAGRRVGSVDVLYLGRKVKTLGLVTTRAVPGSSFVGRLTDALGPALTALALALLVLGGVLAGLKLRSVLGRSQRTVSSR